MGIANGHQGNVARVTLTGEKTMIVQITKHRHTLTDHSHCFDVMIRSKDGAGQAMQFAAIDENRADDFIAGLQRLISECTIEAYSE